MLISQDWDTEVPVGVSTESVDTAVGVHQYHGELVKPAGEVHTLVGVADK